MSRALGFIGLVFMVAVYILFIWTFIDAYMTEGKATTIYIDEYNEAGIELIVLLLSIPCVFMMIKYYLFSDIGWKK